MKKILYIPVILLLVFILSTCAFTGNSSVSVSPVIRGITLPSSSYIGSVELTVSGPGMNTIVIVYDSLPSSIDLAIPSGSDRTFELVVNVDIPIITATSFKGTATADLTQDSVTVYLTMGIGSTKIVVPDPMWNNGLTPRISQFDNINGTNALSLNLAALLVQGLTGVATFNPYDIDFDSQGRIYIANYDFGGSGGIIRIDNITGLNPVLIGTSSGAVRTLSIDRHNNQLYYTDGGSIYKYDLISSSDINIGFAGESINALAVKGNYLYMVDSDVLVKYDLKSSMFVESTDSGNIPQISNLEDILIKDNSIFIANEGGPSGYKILELSTSDLSLKANYGNTVTTVSTSKGNFYGPRRFAAQMNKEITIIDDFNNNDAAEINFDKIIQMNNINGDNWITLPAPSTADETGQTLFEFFTHNNSV